VPTLSRGSVMACSGLMYAAVPRIIAARVARQLLLPRFAVRTAGNGQRSADRGLETALRVFSGEVGEGWWSCPPNRPSVSGGA
jgi:hypothetical protein